MPKKQCFHKLTKVMLKVSLMVLVPKKITDLPKKKTA